jgi:glycosyltransferase involved in cell wall biosynthesis
MSNPKDADTATSSQEGNISNIVLSELRKEIKDLHNQLDALRTHLKNTSLVGRTRRLLAKLSFMRLHQHVQYSPRKMYIPRWYNKPRSLDKPPSISIVTPSYNQGNFLEQTVLSVLDQNYPNLEYAVQDGGSKDSTLAVLDRYKDRLAYIDSRKDRGQGNAINLGFAHATRGEIMAYLNSDDLLLPGTLNYVAAYFAAHPKVDVVYGHRIIINPEGLEIGRWVIPGHSDTMVQWADYVPQETMFWRRSIWEKAGGKIDESFQFALDWDLIVRFRAAGAKFVRLPRFLGAFRVHPSQKTSAEIATTGTAEMAKLRFQLHGREVTLTDIRKHMYGYMLRQGWLNFLYRAGLYQA